MWKKIKSFLFKNTSAKQTLAKNVFWYTASNIVGRLTRAALIVVVARVLGAEGYGIFSYALSLAAFFTIFSDVGVSSILTREVAKNLERKNEYLSTSFFIKLFLLAITVLITVFVAPHFTKLEAAKPLIPIMAFLLTFDSLQNFAFALARAYNRMEIEAILYVVTNFFIVALSIFALVYAPTSKNLAIAYTAGSGLGFAVVYYVLRREFRHVFEYFRKSLAKKIFFSAWPFALVGLLGSIMINTDALMIGWYRTAYDLGLYSAAQRPIQFIYILPGILATSSFPLMARFVHAEEHRRLRAIIEKMLGISFLFGLPLFLGGLILGKPLVVLLFGSEYIGATLTFQILLSTIILYFPGIILSNLIFARDKQKIFITAMTLGAVGNLIFDFLFIPRYGIEGSAAATFIAQLVSNGYIWRTAKKLEEFYVLPYLKKMIAASVIMGTTSILLIALNVPVLINVGLSAFVYFAALLIAKEPLFRELKAILQRAASTEPATDAPLS